MLMKIVYPDGSWFVGNRNRKAIGFPFNHETNGTHHFFVVSGSDEFKSFIGDELAVPVNQAKFFVLNYR